MYRTHARPTTAGVVSTAVMVLRAARLVIAIAPRALNSAEERGSEPELRKSTTAKRQTWARQRISPRPHTNNEAARPAATTAAAAARLPS